MALTDPADALDAPGAWRWLHENRGFGLRAGRVEAYAGRQRGIVEIEAAGLLPVRVSERDFLAGYRHAAWRPIDTAEIARP